MSCHYMLHMETDELCTHSTFPPAPFPLPGHLPLDWNVLCLTPVVVKETERGQRVVEDV